MAFILALLTLPPGSHGHSVHRRKAQDLALAVPARWCGVVWYGAVVWHGVAWRGVAWRGVAWRGVAWHGVVVRCGVGWGGVW